MGFISPKKNALAATQNGGPLLSAELPSFQKLRQEKSSMRCPSDGKRRAGLVIYRIVLRETSIDPQRWQNDGGS
jgi:hypothetical protein